MERETYTADVERADAKIAMLFNLRLQIKKSAKETYTKDEILGLLDAVAEKIKGGIWNERRNIDF